MWHSEHFECFEQASTVCLPLPSSQIPVEILSPAQLGLGIHSQNQSTMAPKVVTNLLSLYIKGPVIMDKRKYVSQANITCASEDNF